MDQYAPEPLALGQKTAHKKTTVMEGEKAPMMDCMAALERRRKKEGGLRKRMVRSTATAANWLLVGWPQKEGSCG